MKKSCCDKEGIFICKWFDLDANYCVLEGQLTKTEIETGCGSFEDWMGKTNES